MNEVAPVFRFSVYAGDPTTKRSVYAHSSVPAASWFQLAPRAQRRIRDFELTSLVRDAYEIADQEGIELGPDARWQGSEATQVIFADQLPA